MELQTFWKAVLAQDADAIRKYFAEGAVINWHCTNERFTVEEYLRANCEYPGKWGGEVERIEQVGGLWITVTRVWPTDKSCSFHVASFLQTAGDRITALDEYWADDGIPPQWRLEKRIGRAIR